MLRVLKIEEKSLTLDIPPKTADSEDPGADWQCGFGDTPSRPSHTS